MKPVIIIGSGLAGYTLSREIRKLDKIVRIQLITADNGHYYSKPMLSNALSKNQSIENLILNTSNEMEEQHDIEVLSNTQVISIDSKLKIITTDKGDYSYSQLVIASGASPISIPMSGNAKQDIISVNSLEDYRVFRKKLEGKKRVTILGAGLIGCEFANDLAASGHQVNIIDLADRPLGRLLPERCAANLKQALSKLNIEWFLERSLKSVNKIDKAYQLTLSDDSILESDLVLSAIGLKAKTDMVANSGISVNRGIAVDQYCQTSESDIYAIGDCAEINGNVLPYVMPIMLGARSLAKTLTGDKTEVVYPVMPVVVKTPAHPVVVCPPPMNNHGQWLEETVGNGIKACCYENDKLTGFALTGDAVNEKQQLIKQL